MSKRINKTLKSGDFLYVSVWLTTIYFFFIDLLSNYFDSGSVGRVYVASIFALMLIYVVLSGSVPKIRIHGWLWVFAAIVVVITSQKSIKSNNLFWVTIYLSLVMLVIMLSGDARWTTVCWKKILSLGGVYIGATIVLFLFSPWLYNATMLNVWGRVPGGCTANDAYKAGLTNHYSSNAIYCGVAFVLIGVKLIIRRSNRIRGREIVALVLTLFALLLTTKRGPLLFALFSLVVTYYVCNPKGGVTKSFYIIAAVVSALIAFFLLAPFVPLFGNILSRFVDAEDISSSRFLFWGQAYSLFLENKIWGIGWGQYVRYNAYQTSAHSIYIQLLCETGIVGFAVFVVAMFSTYVTAINDFRKRSQYLLVEYKQALACAIAVQTFVLAYGLTGNCLYDLTVFAYFISCAVSLSIHYALRRIKLQNRKYKGFMQNESNATIY